VPERIVCIGSCRTFVVATIHGGFIIGKEFGKKDLQEK
jgi:hypothetical protein